MRSKWTDVRAKVMCVLYYVVLIRTSDSGRAAFESRE